MIDTLKLLKKRPKVGISAKDFPPGYRLSSRIHRLRLKGHDIRTIQETPKSLARYVLL